MEASARENSRWALRFKVRRVKANWPEEGQQKNDWSDVTINLTAWESRT